MCLPADGAGPRAAGPPPPRSPVSPPKTRSGGNLMTALTPGQQQVYDSVRRAWPLGQVFCVQGAVGMGKTTLLRRLHQEHGGAFLDLKHLLDAMQERHPLAV